MLDRQVICGGRDDGEGMCLPVHSYHTADKLALSVDRVKQVVREATKPESVVATHDKRDLSRPSFVRGASVSLGVTLGSPGLPQSSRAHLTMYKKTFENSSIKTHRIVRHGIGETYLWRRRGSHYRSRRVKNQDSIDDIAPSQPFQKSRPLPLRTRAELRFPHPCVLCCLEEVK
jgi:hypothetical protein